MIARITDAWTAAPTPCRKRAPISAPWLGASPHRIDAAVKNTTPARNTRLRPNRSPSRPASRRKPPNVTRNAFTTHVRSACVKCRSAWIDGSATFTIVVSSTIISCARQTTTSASQRRRSSVGESEGIYRNPGRKELNWRDPPKVSGGRLRLKNYSGGTLRFVKRFHDDHNRPPRSAPPEPPQARGRTPQLRQGRGRGAGGVRRARRLHLAGGDRPPRRGRNRHALPQLPEPPGAARGRLCRRGREPVRLGGRVRAARALGGLRRLGPRAGRLYGHQAGTGTRAVRVPGPRRPPVPELPHAAVRRSRAAARTRAGRRRGARRHERRGDHPAGRRHLEDPGRRARADRAHHRDRARRPALPAVAQAAIATGSAGGMWWLALKTSCGSHSPLRRRSRSQVPGSKNALASAACSTKFG